MALINSSYWYPNSDPQIALIIMKRLVILHVQFYYNAKGNK